MPNKVFLHFILLGACFFMHQRSVAQSASQCYELLVKAFDKYDFVSNPIPKGKMLRLEINTTVETNSTGTDHVNKETLKSSLFMTNNKNVMISQDVELYSSANCLIQIMNQEKLIYIYDANVDSIRDMQIAQLLIAKNKILESLKNNDCIKLNDTTVKFVLNDEASKSRNQKVMTINSKTGYMLSYLIRFFDTQNSIKLVDTKYTHSNIENESQLMKSDFLNIIYDNKKEIKPKFKNYVIKDIRNLKSSKI